MARLITLIVFLSLAHFVSWGQLQLHAPYVFQQPNQSFTFPVTVQQFDSIRSLQFGIHWDTDVIVFEEVVDFHLPTGGFPNFSYDLVDDGYLKFLWDHPEAEALSLDNDAPIMELKFLVVGAAGSTSPIDFVDVGNLIVSGTAGYDTHSIDIVANNGQVEIETVANQGIEDLKKNIQINPNPSSGDVDILFSLTEPVGDLCWTLVSPTGKELIKSTDNFVVGQHTITIRREDIPASGLFFLSMVTNHGVMTRRIVRQK